MELFDTVLGDGPLSELPVLSLAYVGDGIYELLARQRALEAGAAKVAVLHRRTVAMTRAEAQAAIAQALWPLLSGPERAVFMRGRNAKPHSAPRHATAREYALATGLEALLGWLWLGGRHTRLAELWQGAIKAHEDTV